MKLDHVAAFPGILSMCGRSGLVSEGRKSRSRMMKFERKLSTECYVCMVTCYCQAGLVGEHFLWLQEIQDSRKSLTLRWVASQVRDAKW